MGANGAFVEAPRTREEMRQAASLPVPTLANIHLAGKTPVLPAADIQDLGFSIVAYPAVQTMAVARHLKTVMQTLLERGDVNELSDQMLEFAQFTDLLGLPELRKREADYEAVVQKTGKRLSPAR